MADTAGDPFEDEIRERHLRDFSRGDTVFGEGHGAGSVYLIVSGAVEISSPGASGLRSVERFTAGGVFGEAGASARRAREDTVVALTRTQLLEIDAATFEQLCIDRPDVGLRLIRLLSEPPGGAQERPASVSVEALMRPLVRVLTERAEPHETGIRIRTSLRELADRAGLSMPETHRGLQMLFERKLLRLVGDELAAGSAEALWAGVEPTS